MPRALFVVLSSIICHLPDYRECLFQSLLVDPHFNLFVRIKVQAITPQLASQPVFVTIHAGCCQVSQSHIISTK
ncbi:hypothetical protein AHF37_11400 [Paragonimus kellicotti]|nr:hypothetical protein AHF37_11400 [Paragonimus kellicotti]